MKITTETEISVKDYGSGVSTEKKEILFAKTLEQVEYGEGAGKLYLGAAGGGGLRAAGLKRRADGYGLRLSASA